MVPLRPSKLQQPSAGLGDLPELLPASDDADIHIPGPADHIRALVASAALVAKRASDMLALECHCDESSNPGGWREPPNLPHLTGERGTASGRSGCRWCCCLLLCHRGFVALAVV